MKTTPAFFEDKRIRACAQHTDSATRIFDLGHLYHTSATVLDFINKICACKFILCKCLNVCDGARAQRLAKELDFITLNVLDDHNLELREEMQRKLIHSITQNALLH